MTDTPITPTHPDALAKLAEIPAGGSEERDLWLEAAEQYGLLEPAADDENWVGSEADILTLMSEARKQGQRDALRAAPATPDGLRSLLDDALALLEIGDEANTPGTDTYTFIVTAKEVLRQTDAALETGGARHG